ncbi:MAG: peptide chain release factor family protein [Phycisphaerales bacterium]
MPPFIAGESDWPHPACLNDDDLLREVRWTRGRGSGPGGQNRNKVETGVELVHTPTGITGRAGERRTVTDNKRVAIRRLRLNLATQHRVAVPLGEVGSRLWAERRRMPPRPGPGDAPQRWGTFPGRIVINPDHRDYPSLLAEAMDVIHAAGWDVQRAGLRLEVTMTQLIKLIAEHPPALAALNAGRESMGLSALRH